MWRFDGWEKTIILHNWSHYFSFHLQRVLSYLFIPWNDVDHEPAAFILTINRSPLSRYIRVGGGLRDEKKKITFIFRRSNTPQQGFVYIYVSSGEWKKYRRKKKNWSRHAKDWKKYFVVCESEKLRRTRLIFPWKLGGGKKKIIFGNSISKSNPSNRKENHIQPFVCRVEKKSVQYRWS